MFVVKIDGNYYAGQNKKYADIYKFRLPEWGYADYINERNMWVKRLSTGLDEPNWLYCRLFFNFDTYHGLFGGILNYYYDKEHRVTPQNNAMDNFTSDVSKAINTFSTSTQNSTQNKYSDKEEDESIIAVNSAYTYLKQIKQMKELYTVENPGGRLEALKRFVYLLSQINMYSPWIFKGISNVNNASNITNDLTQNHTFELQLNVDTVDWRISTLLSLYKYACYDDMNQKEILPDNLRKFDVTVVLFSVPIKYIHTPLFSIDSSGTGHSIRKPYKQIWDAKNGVNNIMSTKVYQFIGCEINMENFGAYIPASITNEKPFQLANNNLQIKYDRVYEYMFNEYELLLVGSNGIASWDVNGTTPGNNLKSTLNILKEVDERTSVGELLLSAADYYAYGKLNVALGNANYVLGNIYGQDRRILGVKVDNQNYSKITEYFKNKTRVLMGNKLGLTDIGYNLFYKWMGSSMKQNTAPSADGTGTILTGGGELGVGSTEWKLNMIKLFYPDYAINGVHRGLTSREKRYQVENNAKNFNLMGFLNNKTQSMLGDKNALIKFR